MTFQLLCKIIGICLIIFELLVILLYVILPDSFPCVHDIYFDFDKYDEESNQDQIDNTAKIGDNNV